MSTCTTTLSPAELIPPMSDMSFGSTKPFKSVPKSTRKPIVFIRHDTFSRFVEFEGEVEVCELVLTENL